MWSLLFGSGKRRRESVFITHFSWLLMGAEFISGQRVVFLFLRCTHKQSFRSSLQDLTGIWINCSVEDQEKKEITSLLA